MNNLAFLNVLYDNSFEFINKNNNMKNVDMLYLHRTPLKLRELIMQQEDSPCLINGSISYICCKNLNENLKNRILTEDFNLYVNCRASSTSTIILNHRVSLFFTQKSCINPRTHSFGIGIEFNGNDLQGFNLEVRNQDAYHLYKLKLEDKKLDKDWLIENDKVMETKFSPKCNIS